MTINSDGFPEPGNGRWERKVITAPHPGATYDDLAFIPHICPQPPVDLAKHGNGSLWRCGCGKVWRLDRNGEHFNFSPSHAI